MDFFETKKYFKVWFRFSAVIILLLCSCSSCSFETLTNRGAKISLKSGLKVAGWNTQTFFDAVESGNEYAEFRGKNTKWSLDFYTERLKRLCAVLEKINADIITLQEIENEGVVRDIANMLPISAGYRFASFAKDEKNPFGCAVLSRLEIESVKTHQITLLSEDFPQQPDLRPIMEVVFKTPVSGEPPLVLFICHWKSKSGGEEKSEIWRESQEDLLLEAVSRYDSQSAAVIALGDFNREPHEFSSDFFERFDCGWDSVAQGGSYFYQGEWNRIDHIFALKQPNILFARFTAESDGPHAKADGTPLRYSVFNGEGYSDHLPVSAVVAY